MANVDKRDFLWNGKLSGAVNLLYSDLLNVDVVKPPYSWWDRNSSFFLQTRLWYICEPNFYHYITSGAYWSHSINWEVTDVQIIWDTTCSEENWTGYILIHNIDDDFRALMSCRIENGCVNDFNVMRDSWFNTCDCWDWKLFKTNAPRGNEVTVTTNDSAETWYWIQVNILEGWVYRWYFTTEKILDWTDSWWNIATWDYLVVTDSSNTKWSGFAWQTRMVTGFSDDGKYLVLDTPWNGFAVADENWNTYKRVEWRDVTATAFSDEWEVIWLSKWRFIDIFTDTNWSSYIEYEPTNWCIVSITESNWRVFALYSNGFVRYSKVWGRDQFFFDDEMYAWIDKTSLYGYRDFILAFGKRNIAVGTPTEFNNQMYYTMYQQSNTIWLKSRYSYWEHDGNLIFVSNDNRLMALWVAATSWKYMLSFEDIWQEVICWKLASMLDTDEAYVVDYNNELRILVQTKSNPVKEDSKNNQTHIYKFDNHYKVWTEDHLQNILMKGYYWWIWYWLWWLYIRGAVETDDNENYDITHTGRAYDDTYEVFYMDFRQPPNLSVSNMTYPPVPVEAKVWAFLVENEQNWLSTQTSKAPDLFDLVKLNRLIVTLGFWSYSPDYTKIKITSYREWVWVVQTIDDITTNDWANMITYAYNDKPMPEEVVAKKKCLFSLIEEDNWQPYNDNITRYHQECTAQDVKVTDLVKDSPRCEWSKKINFQDHNVCVDSSLYELAPHMPLLLNLWNTQSYSSQVKVEIISTSWDVLNFGWFLAELFIAPFGAKWADWENLIEMSSC